MTALLCLKQHFMLVLAQQLLHEPHWLHVRLISSAIVLIVYLLTDSPSIPVMPLQQKRGQPSWIFFFSYCAYRLLVFRCDGQHLWKTHLCKGHSWKAPSPQLPLMIRQVTSVGSCCPSMLLFHLLTKRMLVFDHSDSLKSGQTPSRACIHIPKITTFAHTPLSHHLLPLWAEFRSLVTLAGQGVRGGYQDLYTYSIYYHYEAQKTASWMTGKCNYYKPSIDLTNRG